MKFRSKVTDLVYEGMDVVYISNPLQCARYIKHGATLYDVFENKDCLVCVFKKDETKELYDRWCKHELL